jgi:hypothetical protein
MPSSSLPLCPFHDGAATLDGLLAAIDPRDGELFDAALDLRSLLTEGGDATAALHQLFRLRRLLDGRHYLAFYRVRRWVQRRIVAQVRAGRAAPWRTRELPLDAARLDEIVNASVAAVAAEDAAPHVDAQVRFVFRPAPPVPADSLLSVSVTP